MKKKVLAVLLAICMIAGTGVLFASAADTSVATGDILISSKKAIKGDDYEIEVTVTPRSDVELPASVKSPLKADMIDKVFTFTKTGTTTTYNYKGELENYINAVATVEKAANGETAVIKFSASATTDDKKMGAKKAITDFTYAGSTATSEEMAGKVVDTSVAKYAVKTTSATNTVDLVKTLYTFTTGVHFYGDNTNNLVAAEIAKVTIYVKREGQEKETKAVADKIYDLTDGDHVRVVTQLKDVKDEDGKTPDQFYAFNYWVDGSNKVLGKGVYNSVDQSYTWEFDVTGDSALYANYVEKVDRHTISYSTTGNGSIVYKEAREVFKGDGQISVLDGKRATFTFVPEDGYEVEKVLVNNKNVAGLMSLINSSDLLKSLKVLIAATDKDNYTYTFPATDTMDSEIVVTFRKVTPLELEGGKELPTVSVDGIVIETGAAAEGSEGGAAGTTVPAENGASAGGSAATGVVNPATGSGSAVAVFATLTVAAAAAFVTAKKKED